MVDHSKCTHPAQLPGKEPEFEDNIIPGSNILAPSGHDNIVGRKNQSGKIESGGCFYDSVRDRVAQTENSICPKYRNHCPWSVGILFAWILIVGLAPSFFKIAAN